MKRAIVRCLIGLLLPSCSWVFDEVGAREYWLLDEDGEIRGGFFMVKSSPVLMLFDSNKQPRIALTAGDGQQESRVTIHDQAGRMRLALAVATDRTVAIALDEQGRLASVLGVVDHARDHSMTEAEMRQAADELARELRGEDVMRFMRELDKQIARRR